MFKGQASEWLPVSSEVPRGAVLELVLFITCIIFSLSKFADETKAYAKGSTTVESEIIK